jgi:hypothetical protein
MVLAYASAELQRGQADSAARAMHVLVWLGIGGAYARFKAPVGSSSAFEPDRCNPAALSF